MYSTTNEPIHRRSTEFGIFCRQLDGAKEVIFEFLNDGLNNFTNKFDKVEKEYYKIREENYEEGERFYQQDYEPRRLATYEIKELISFTSVSFLFTQFETKFIELANRTHELFGSIGYNEYEHKCRNKNKGINKAKHFIMDTSKIDISDIEGSWSKIKQLQNLRHCIIHRNGSVNKEKSIIQFAKGNDYLNYHKESDMIQIKKEFIEEYAVILFDYLEQVVIKLYNKLNE